METVKDLLESEEINRKELEESWAKLNQRNVERWNESTFCKSDTFPVENLPDFIENLKTVLDDTKCGEAVEELSDRLSDFVRKNEDKPLNYQTTFGTHCYYIVAAKSAEGDKLFVLYGVHILDVKFAPRTEVAVPVYIRILDFFPWLKYLFCYFFFNNVFEKMESDENETDEMLSLYRKHEILKEFKKRNLIDKINYV